jgi:uncharacterized membrane protein (DUF485 family)
LPIPPKRASAAGAGGAQASSRTNPGPANAGDKEHAMQPDKAPSTGIAPDAGQFSALVRKRWTVSLTLTALMLSIYYGFIVILAFRPDIFAAHVGRVTLGIPVGLGVIIASWLLTGLYVRWANDDYDTTVATIKHAMREKQG